MNVGACGLLCMLCREYEYGLCGGCMRGDMCPPDVAESSPCPILRCAASRQVAYCSHDCPDFACALIREHPPVCWSSTAPSHPVASSRQPGPATVSWGRFEEQFTHHGLRIYCLGPFRAFTNGTEILEDDWGHKKGPTHKIKAMLAYLICRGGRGARKETMMDLLWPDQQDATKASDSFHQALHCLRRALEPELAAGGVSGYISFEHGRYRFRPLKPAWIDAEAFEWHCRQAQRCLKTKHRELADIHWALALDLYRGDFMADIAIEYTENRDYEWCLPRRTWLRKLYAAARLAASANPSAAAAVNERH